MQWNDEITWKSVGDTSETAEEKEVNQEQENNADR